MDQLSISDQFSTSVPDSVILSPDLPNLAKLLYVFFLQLSKAGDHRCLVTQAQIAKLMRLSRSSVAAQIKTLDEAGLIRSLGRGEYYVMDQAAASWMTLLDQVKKRLVEAPYLGEALMREWLTLLIFSDRWTDGARPGYAVSPLTGERFEFDRLYELDKPNAQGYVAVAFEYNGPQHYGATAKYPSDEEARKRRGRDLMKLGLAVEAGVKVIIIHRQDLSLEGMLAKIGPWIPIRQGYRKNPVTDYLELESRAYRNNMSRKRQSKAQ